ncbi:MAG TPA: MotA/TolQ/ExbB proton channel family protein [Pirellulales bacterium]|jgi:biopolymer transport protein ExbB
MNVNLLAKFLGDSTYGFLALNLLFGLFCAILVWRRLRELRFRSDDEQQQFLNELNETLSAGDFEAAIERCELDPRALPQLTRVVLMNRDLDQDDLRQVVAERLQRDVLGPMENRINWILTVVRNGPLLGLFGTVLGMMAAFGRIGTGEKVQPSQIADEIAVALICTAMGLGTAIPLGYIANTLNIRIRDLQETLSHALMRLLSRFRPPV